MRRLNVTHPQISLEDFIYYYHIAHKRKNIRALNQLCHLYPELSVMAFQNDSLSKRYDPSEYDYYRWHPITLGSAYMTERRIMDMVAYLFSRDRAPKGYKPQTPHGCLVLPADVQLFLGPLSEGL